MESGARSRFLLLVRSSAGCGGSSSKCKGGYAVNPRAGLESKVLGAAQAGDAMMVKGSIGSRMAPIVKALPNAPSHVDR